MLCLITVIMRHGHVAFCAEKPCRTTTLWPQKLKLDLDLIRKKAAGFSGKVDTRHDIFSR